MEHPTTQPSALVGLLLATTALAAPTLKIPANEVSVDKSNKRAENNTTPINKANNVGNARIQGNDAHPSADNVNGGYIA
ncbi:hypothetical protein BDV27DRAFT_154654 [Aspergillus caelatus]|uniref:Uncharacterized protein n=2 Tax=Aspergillus subgen. Circumdati TaxID=2720871 RepID=A0A5N7ADJ0_9EURO|nr:uncharacterized protein BDV27DRAFT_154654 [Aspergillus caelatus]KAE8367765.1 hypothetical protein BDV27DRAFT_154654 [Aspergillus caelatus]KAE8423211.1 hypothetical protein BDV36DRAFT_244113 [Aspergillus pseudocaelatus]